MKSGKKNIDNKLDDHLLFMKDLSDTNKKVTEEPRKNWTNMTLNFPRSRHFSNIFLFIIKLPRQTRCIHQNLRILPLCSSLTRRIYHWKVDILQNWWHVDSQTWYQLTKILWTPHQDRTQSRHWSGPQELLQSHQDVSKWGE